MSKRQMIFLLLVLASLAQCAHVAQRAVAVNTCVSDWECER